MKKSRGNYRWQPQPNNYHIPVRAEASSSESFSNASGKKSPSSGKAVRHTSGGGTSINETLAGHQGRGWTTCGSGSSAHGGSAIQWTKYSDANNASDFHRRFGSLRLDAAQMLGKSMSEAKIPESASNIQESETSEHRPIVKFDICPPRKSSMNILKPSLHTINIERRKENERTMGRPKGAILRQGMVLLKNYLSTAEQASILNICQHHGLETVGFEDPIFGEGRKMHLKLMCYGMYFDHTTHQYGDVRSVDKAKPPPIHPKLLELVDRAVKDSQSLLSENLKVKNVASILPSVKPDVCLVNYYTHTGRLGLHQDKSESRESLSKGIPIVSFSIGDSAEFIYGDQRDVEEAQRVILQSGDVLIFGGQARHIFHGVPKILDNTAPRKLIEETNFRKGRLNLTFRQRF